MSEAAPSEESTPDDLTIRIGFLEHRVELLGGHVQAMADTMTKDMAAVRAEIQNLGRLRPSESVSITRLLRELTEPLAGLDRLAGRLVDVPDEAGIAGLVASLRQRFDEVLDDWGITAITPAPGDSFDPELHEPDGFGPTGDNITSITARGWQLGTIVLRPAVVALGEE